ncbi:GntR family transcriptional regulator [Caballeronia sordidicola]|uniref:GntR family transcriptional regulator n=1 Tax=Caballeronia sordidicola TaxID=196367 RepID=A0A158HDZ3_CABSO|nr:GntR family transcriptional regulator [Caballeronia sordidicola]SAL42622.1 GntR family transcriptional regulator [Caballeronia sordidicola]
MTSKPDRKPLMPMQDYAAPLYRRIKDQLRARMLDGTYAPDAQLPTEQALCDMFDVSRITVRQALDELRQEGAVKTVRGRGTFVAPPRAYQNIAALQGFSEAMIPLGHQVTNRLEGFRYFDPDVDLRARLGLDTDVGNSVRVAEIKRIRILDGTRLSFETTFLGELLAQKLMTADLATQDIFKLVEERSAVRIDHANVAVDAILADEETLSALELAPGSPVLRVERHVFDIHARPVLFEFLHFRSDAFQYRMRIDRER